jgi:hypothetical protein
MGRDAFLLGAGFSKAVSEHMPLMEELGQVPMHFRGDWPRGLIRSMSFEELLTFLSTNQPWLSEADNLQNRATFLEASQQIAGRLQIQEGKALSEPIPEWLSAFVSRLHEDAASVVSLNYDTLIEHAWTEQRRQEEPDLNAVASHASLYAVPIQSALARTRLVRDPFAGSETLRLMKLHGSTNWCYSGSEMASGEEIYDRGLPPGWRVAELPRDVRDVSIDKVPLLVPPTLGKSPFFVNETVRSVWKVASRSFREAERVFALGYSLPESDHNMLGLLRSSLGRDFQSIHVVNLNEDVGPRYERLLNVVTKVEAQYTTRGVSAFVSDYLDSRI